MIQNPKPENWRYKRPSCVVVYDDHAEVEVFGDDQPHIIDVKHAEEVAKYRWIGSGSGYARAFIGRSTAYLHRFIFGIVPTDLELDHIDRNKRNNQRTNLRAATRTENNRNASRRRNNTSGVPGVSWNKEHGAWRVRIGFNGKRHHLGYFDNLDEATAARKAAEIELFGTFAPTS